MSHTHTHTLPGCPSRACEGRKVEMVALLRLCSSYFNPAAGYKHTAPGLAVAASQPHLTGTLAKIFSLVGSQLPSYETTKKQLLLCTRFLPLACSGFRLHEEEKGKKQLYNVLSIIVQDNRCSLSQIHLPLSCLSTSGADPHLLSHLAKP